ncbi:MAG: hypothetical protein H6Q15_1231 [Bacteroidetes bacterium]|nr:hypothetical protein [Bacteroidota bacterium]
MKKNIIRFFCFALLLLVSVPFLSGCKEEDNSCKLKVMVKQAANPAVRVPGAKIVIAKESSYIKREGVTDSQGEAFFSFDNEAIFDINVNYQVFDTTGALVSTSTGKSTVRLVPGETVEKEVLIQPVK